MRSHAALLLLLGVSSAVGVALAQCDASSPLGPSPASVNGASGYCFRVWAPNAGSATVEPKGSSLALEKPGFNGTLPALSWSSTTMSKNSSSGVWTAFVSGAAPGDAYGYQFNGNLQRIDPRAQGIASGTNSFAYSVIHDPNFDWADVNVELPTPETAVVYEMHIPSFSNNGAGTFATAQAKLPYLAKLGVNMIELMPIATFCGGTTGWGYNPCAPYAAMESMGGYKGLKSLVNAANQLGIGVMLDVVWNHMDGGNALKDFDGNTGGDGNGIYFYESSPNAETLWGPRPDYSSQPVVNYVLDSVRMWLEEYHISGFRWDSTICIRKPAGTCWTQSDNLDDGWRLMQGANSLTKKLNPSAVTSAEDSQGWNALTASVSDQSTGLPGARGGAGFVSQWGYTGFFYSFYTQLTEFSNTDVDMGTVASLASSSSEGTRVLFTENHDMASNQNHGRIPDVVNPGGDPSKPSYWALKKAMLGVSVVMTSPGIPMLLQGQEFITYAAFEFPTPPPLDWSLVSANAGSVQEVTDLIALRTNRNGVTTALMGSGANVIQTVDTSTSKVAVIHRYNGDDHALVVINMYQNKCATFGLSGVPKDGSWKVVFNGDSNKYSSQFSNCGSSYVSVSGGRGNMNMPPYSVVVLVYQGGNVATDKVASQ